MPHSSWGQPGLSRTVKINVPGGGIQLNVNPELELIFQTLVDRLHEARVRNNRSPLTSSGGYNKRKISGSSTWSNHSWGLAGDFNAGSNPYSYLGRTDFPVDETRQIAKSLGFRWGWDYSGKKDAMHFEYMGSREDAARLTAQLRGASHPDPKPVPATPAPAPQPAPVRPAPAPTPSVDWSRVMNDLSYLGFNQDDRDTRVRAFQTAAGIKVDGDPGPETLRHMSMVGQHGRYPGSSTPAPRTYNAATERYQRRLRERGWVIDVDGYHGDETSAKFARFQQGQTGLSVDGKGGPQMWTALHTRPVT